MADRPPIPPETSPLDTRFHRELRLVGRYRKASECRKMLHSEALRELSRPAGLRVVVKGFRLRLSGFRSGFGDPDEGGAEHPFADHDA